MNLYEKGARELLTDVGTKLHSNKAINSAYDFLATGGIDLYNTMAKGLNSGNFMDAAAEVYKKDGQNWSAKAIAGSYIAGASAYRIASGGGLTKDRNGNNNIIGIPMI